MPIPAAPVQDRVGTAPLLSVKGIGVQFGGVVALDDVSFDIFPGQICGLIGPNGAGKTTFFNVLSRLYRAQRGSIEFSGRPLLEIPAHRIAAVGLGRTFQNLATFKNLTVRQNVMMGAHSGMRTGFWANMLSLPSARREEAEIAERAEDMLRRLELESCADVAAGSLPFGVLKRVEFARSLISAPSLLLLDEPAGGLNHDEVEKLRSLIQAVRDEFHVTVLLVEHHMNLVMRISDKVVVLNFGKKIADGSPAELRNDEQVIHAYLGETQ